MLGWGIGRQGLTSMSAVLMMVVLRTEARPTSHACLPPASECQMGGLHVTTTGSDTSWRSELSSRTTVRCVHTVEDIPDTLWRDEPSSRSVVRDKTVNHCVHNASGISDTGIVDDFPYWSVLNLPPGVHLEFEEPPLRFAPDDHRVYRDWEARRERVLFHGVLGKEFLLPLGKDRRWRFRSRPQSEASVRRRKEKASTQQRQTEEDLKGSSRLQ